MLMHSSIKLFQSTPLYARGDVLHRSSNYSASYFNPRPSTRGATLVNLIDRTRTRFQSTPLYARGDNCRCDFFIDKRISIHAPLREGRLLSVCWHRQHNNFNPRPSTRGATIHCVCLAYLINHFNPRPSTRGATSANAFSGIECCISIHAPLREGRRNYMAFQNPDFSFQSTPLYARGDVSKAGSCNGRAISIHAPLREGRPPPRRSDLIRSIFQSTPLYARGDVFRDPYHGIKINISIHAPLREGRHRGKMTLPLLLLFQSTPLYARGDAPEVTRVERK